MNITHHIETSNSDKELSLIKVDSSLPISLSQLVYTKSKKHFCDDVHSTAALLGYLTCKDPSDPVCPTCKKGSEIGPKFPKGKEKKWEIVDHYRWKDRNGVEFTAREVFFGDPRPTERDWIIMKKYCQGLQHMADKFKSEFDSGSNTVKLVIARPEIGNSIPGFAFYRVLSDMGIAQNLDEVTKYKPGHWKVLKESIERSGWYIVGPPINGQREPVSMLIWINNVVMVYEMILKSIQNTPTSYTEWIKETENIKKERGLFSADKGAIGYRKLKEVYQQLKEGRSGVVFKSVSDLDLDPVVLNSNQYVDDTIKQIMIFLINWALQNIYDKPEYWELDESAKLVPTTTLHLHLICINSELKHHGIAKGIFRFLVEEARKTAETNHDTSAYMTLESATPELSSMYQSFGMRAGRYYKKEFRTADLMNEDYKKHLNIY